MLDVTVMLTSPEMCTTIRVSFNNHRSIHTITVNLDTLAELTGLSPDLDTIVEVLFEGSAIEDTVTSGTGVVDDEFVLSGGLSGGGL